MLNKEIKEEAKKHGKKIGRKAIKKIIAILSKKAEEIIKKSARNADFSGRKIIKEGDVGETDE